MTKNGTSAAEGAKLIAALPADMSEAINNENSQALLLQLRGALAQLIAESGYPGDKDAAIDKAVMALFDWEFALCKQPPPQTPAPRVAIDIKAVLEQSTRQQGGVFGKARVVKCTPLHGGFGKNTTLFEVEDEQHKTWQLVSRAMQDINLLGLPGQDIGKEFHLVRYAYRHGIRAAEPLWLQDDKHDYGVRFFVSRQVPGRNLGTAVSSEPISAAQVRSLAQQMAAIHQLPLDATDADLQRGPLDLACGKQSLIEVVSDYLHLWEKIWRAIDAGPWPVVEATFKWLHANLPRPDDVPTFLHGDYALHNILIDGGEIGGVLDWEMAHVGDRAEDISWLLSSIGKYVSQEQFMAEYLAAGGRPVSQFQLKFYEVLVHLKLLIVTIESQLRFQTLPQAGPHFCILGFTFMQHPAASLEGAIKAAEATR
jgi:aminoglycoside phosphotransferase (APT) family kinase protein